MFDFISYLSGKILRVESFIDQLTEETKRPAIRWATPPVGAFT
jgi:hypothetical protein